MSFSPHGSISFPGSSDAKHQFLRLTGTTGTGSSIRDSARSGFDHKVYADFSAYIPDAGLGFESSFRLRKYRFFLSGIVAQALKGNGGVEARISVKSYR